VAEHYAIVIAGGGPVGAALALGLRASGHRIALLEARVADAVLADARVIALSYGSRLILERLGVWSALPQVTPILTITVSQQRRFGRVELTAPQAGVPALGYVVSYAALQRALLGALAGSEVAVLNGCQARDFTGRADGAVLSIECAGVTRDYASAYVWFSIAAGRTPLEKLRSFLES